MSDASATRLDDAGRRVVEAFRERFGRPPATLVRAPGRVAILGAHVDYSDGWVLPAAIDRAVWLAAAPRDDRRWRLLALDVPRDDGRPAERMLDLDALPPPRPQRGDGETQIPAWVDLPAGVATVLSGLGRGSELGGLDIAFGGDLPQGAGLSSSAAVEVAFLLVATAPSAAPLDRPWLAVLGRRVENEYLGVGSGVMDQFASLHGRAGRALLLDCRTLEHEELPLPDDLAILVADTGVRRRLAGSGFDDRRAQCAEAVERLRPVLGEPIRALRDVSLEQLELHAHRLPPPIRRRAWHAVTEMARVRAAADDLRRGDLERFGRRMRASHAGSRDLYEVSIPELDVLAAAAWAADGCWGARLTGGGFGGCVVALSRRDAGERVSEAMHDAFECRFGRRPTMLRVVPADGATVVHL